MTQEFRECALALFMISATDKFFRTGHAVFMENIGSLLEAMNYFNGFAENYILCMHLDSLKSAKFILFGLPSACRFTSNCNFNEVGISSKFSSSILPDNMMTTMCPC